MITTENSPVNYKNPKTGLGVDGVVRISIEGSYGTGSLLYSGYHILTAAHLFRDQMQAGSNVNSDQITIQFDTASGSTYLSVQQVFIHPDYQSENSNFDLALITLSGLAPSDADRYNLYRGDQEGSTVATLVGYGRQGTGLTGDDLAGEGRVRAQNHLEMTAGELEAARGDTLTWKPDADSILVADFDQGSSRYDTLGQITGNEQLGTGIYEGLIASGDSGGPAFINGQLAGVASYTSSLSHPDTDIDSESNSSYGELGFWQRVSTSQEWIDRSLREQYDTTHLINAATGKPDTEKVTQPVTEGDDSWVFFLLELNGRSGDDGGSDDGELITVNYSTRNGSAVAGEDYIATAGSITFYAGEEQVWIPVELIDDNIPEPEEVFYLAISNPQGAAFPDNQTELIAQRTLLDDDGWLF